MSNDLSDVVQNADLQEWQEVFVVLCTFASEEEFSGLAEQLGRRLEYQSSIVKDSSTPDAVTKALEFRRHATLTYLAAGQLERLVNIWVEELNEEEKQLVSDERRLDDSHYSAHTPPSMWTTISLLRQALLLRIRCTSCRLCMIVTLSMQVFSLHRALV